MLAWTNPIINAIGNTTLCFGDSVLLFSNTNPSFIYKWYRNGVLIPGATTSQYKAYQSGDYKIEISNAANCSLFSNVISVVVAIPILNTIQPSGPIINICKDNSFILTAALTPNVTYQWYQNNVPISGATSNLFSISIPGTYFVKFTSNSGCVKYSDTLIVGNYPVTPPVFQFIAPNLSVGSYMTYQWYFNSQPIPGATTNSISLSQNGVYYVHVKDFNECEYDSSPYILDNLGIAISNENSIKAYPNPTTNKVHIINVIFKTVLIKNQLGQIISKQTTNEEIDFSEFSDGLYAVSLYNEEDELVGTIKITKQ
jgi:hypothetical protein